ncbi:hypothetical protein M2454_001202 [Aequitasia blattaphilus]|uniref:Twitching motility protein PilT n=1 Tax=Aequitasia blattaphilus TaxID=2949332 RepID=A0ABT1E9B8_9FIRM|nr:hypothetical protein [Aequitasia blattaphilus]MCP1101466.1 hypothetical protein [Aequitasia blattaphilus]MCR8614106.1 hypothetical protein [Aequitasia blattaphilus]
MVNLFIGPKGSGKTPDIIAQANEQEKVENGSVVFIKKTHRNTKEISFNIRTICMEDFPDISTVEMYVGFLYGIISSNADIHHIYIDELLKIKSIELESLPSLIEFLKTISKDHSVDFHVSISATQEETATMDISECNVIHY